jgi:hypothetical protein
VWCGVRKSPSQPCEFVECDEKWTQCLGIKLGHPVIGKHKYRDLVLQFDGGGKANKIVLQKDKELFQNPKK